MNYVSSSLPVWPGDIVIRRENVDKTPLKVLDTYVDPHTGSLEVLTSEDAWKPLSDYVLLLED
jgi:hypothetical protein